MKNVLKLTNAAKSFVNPDFDICKKVINEFEQSIFQDFEKFLGLKWVPEEDTTFLMKTCFSNFKNYKLPPGVFELSGIILTSKTISTTNEADNKTMDAKVKMNNNLRLYD